MSKPVRAPFRDGTSVLVRNMLRAMPSHVELAYFGDPAAPVRPVGDTVIAATAMRYQPGMTDKLRMLGKVLSPGLVRLPIHSFFAANRNSSRALELLRRVPRRRTIMQTLPASTGAAAVAGLLGRLDRVVVTSDWGRALLIEAGVASERVVRIYPGVELPQADESDGVDPAPVSERRSLLFAGDLDPDVGERLIALARGLERCPGWCLEIATRPKGEDHRAVRQRLAVALGPAEAAGRVQFLGEVPSMAALFDRAAIQLYLASHARKKVDIPFVLLEGMARGVPAAVVRADPVAELLDVAADAQLEVGLDLDPRAFDGAVEALVALIDDPGRLERMGAAARELVDQRFGAAEMATRYHQLYEELS